MAFCSVIVPKRGEMKPLLRALLLVCLISGLFAPTPTHAQEGQPPDPPAPGPQIETAPIPILRTRHVTLAGVDFRPSGSNVTYSSTNGGIFPKNLVTGYEFYAPLHLPRGASVTRIDYFYVDNSNANNITFGLIETNLDTNFSNVSFTATTAGASSAIQTLPVSMSPGLGFDNQKAYRFGLNFEATNGAQYFYGARVTYTLPLFMPISDEYITIAGADFSPVRSDLEYQTLGHHLYLTAMPFQQNALLTARVDLPNGAEVDQIEYFVIDAGPADIDLYALGTDPNFGGYPISSGAKSSGTSGTQTVLLSGSPIISAENATNAYLLGVMLPDDTPEYQIVGARLRYSPAAAVSGMQTRTYAGVFFKPTGSDLTYMGVEAAIYGTAAPNGRSFQLNLDLPDGVMVRSVTYFVTDISNEYYFQLGGRTYVPEKGLFDDPFIGTTSSPLAEPTIREITYAWPSGPTYRFDSYKDSFRLRVVPQGNAQEDLMLFGARVDYFYPRFLYLPLVGK
jgi:hypothetical protein